MSLSRCRTAAKSSPIVPGAVVTTTVTFAAFAARASTLPARTVAANVAGGTSPGAGGPVRITAAPNPVADRDRALDRRGLAGGIEQPRRVDPEGHDAEVDRHFAQLRDVLVVEAGKVREGGHDAVRGQLGGAALDPFELRELAGFERSPERRTRNRDAHRRRFHRENSLTIVAADPVSTRT